MAKSFINAFLQGYVFREAEGAFAVRSSYTLRAGGGWKNAAYMYAIGLPVPL